MPLPSLTQTLHHQKLILTSTLQHYAKIISYKLIGKNGITDFAPKDVFIKEENGLITFDFFPIDHFDYLEENPSSEFIIKCKEISYEVLSSE